jgi:periplasmic mercuric ion binding protein
MKSLKLTLLTLFAFVLVSKAQQQQKVIIHIPGLQQCDVCQERLENYIKMEPGVLSAVVDLKKKIATIVFLPDRNDVDGLETAIANAGYDADDVQANDDSYKQLPACCKKPVTDSTALKTVK